MAREIRISIDDDEVFERMKARKRALELSWEEVLHRGLRQERAHSSDAVHDAHRGTDPRQTTDSRSGQGYREPPPPPDPLSNPSGFAEDLKRQIQGQVRESLHASLGPDRWDEPSYGDPLEHDVHTLESAEDATLVFGFLGEEGGDVAHRIPLRVTLEASTDGLTADVVAVRQGKGVAGMNAFDPGVRQRIVEGLATGETATLEFEFGEGLEQYAVAPSLTWSRDERGRPAVVEVSIDEVCFDVE